MKPIKLVIKGLNSFIEEQMIDFEKLTDRGLFGIFGPTGSGKSTILDGITLALYGDIARKSSNFINTNCNDLNVSFTFQISGSVNRTYIVNRQFRRDKKTGNAKTHAASVREITEQGEEVLADSATSVNKTCREILGLSLDDFTRTVVLPQGKFSEFLKLEGKQRREMLERLFNLQDYGERLGQRLSRQMSLEKEKSNQLIGELNTYEDISEEKLVEQQKLLQQTTKALEEAQEKQNEVEKRYKAGEEVWNLQRELKSYREQEQIFKNHSERMKQEEVRLSRGESALKVMPFITAYEKRQEELVDYQRQQNQLQDRLKTLTIKKEEVEALFKAVSVEKDENLPELRLKEQQLKEVIEDSTKLINLEEIIEQTKFGLNKVQENIKAFSDKETESTTHILKISEVIELAQREEQNLRIDPLLRSKVEEGVKLSQTYAFEQKNYEKHKKDQGELQRVREIYQLEWKQLNDLCIKVSTQLEESLKKQEAHINQIPVSQEELFKKQEQLTVGREKWQRCKQLRKEIESYVLQNKVDEERIQALESRVGKQKAVVENLKQQVEQEKMNYLAHTLRQHLTGGEPCPVCGSLERPVQHNLKEEQSVKPEMAQVEMQLSNEEAILDTLQKEFQQVQAQVSANQVSIERLQKEIAPLEELFKETDIEAEEKEFVLLTEAIKNFEEKKQIIEQEINTLKEEKNRLETETKQKQTILEENDKQRVKSEEELKKQIVILKQIEEPLESLKKEVNTQDFMAMFQELRVKDQKREELLSHIKGQNEQKEILIQNKEVLQEKLNKYKASFERGLAQYDEQQKNKQDIIKRMGMRIRDLLSLQENKNMKLYQELQNIIAFFKSETLLRGQLKGEIQYGSVLLMKQEDEQQEMGSLKQEMTLQSCYDQYPLIGKSLEVLKMRLEILKSVMCQAAKEIEESFIQIEVHKEAVNKEHEQVSNHVLEVKTRLQGIEKQLKDDLAHLQQGLIEENLTEDEVRQYVLSKETLEEMRSSIQQYKEDYSKLIGAIEAVEVKLGDRSLDLHEWNKLQEEKQSILDEVTARTKDQINLITLVKNIEKALERLGNLRDEKKKIDHKMGILTDLEKLFKGKKFVEFVAATRLKYVSLEASKKLKEITGGNYGLEVDEDSKFIIRDYKNGGVERDASTLSGGETFLASLALALALSSEIQLKGTAPLELFFLDEGFGTLDEHLLEVVMGSLESIHHDRLKVGIISHVETIKNRVPVKLLLTPAKSGLGGTKVRLERS